VTNKLSINAINQSGCILKIPGSNSGQDYLCFFSSPLKWRHVS